MHPSTARIVAAILLTATAATAQLRWTELAPTARPPAGAGGAMVQTPQGLLLLAGQPTPGTWILQDGRWRDATIPPQPSPRTLHAMAYDPLRDRVVLFGGRDGARLDDTWEWDGTGWRRVQTATRPPGRFAAAMAFDAHRRGVVLFGGAVGNVTGAQVLGDTWIFDGADWHRLVLPYEPPARSGAAMAGDGELRLVLFGGRDAFGALDDTWELAPGGWRRLGMTLRPPARAGHSLTYDAPRARFVLHGGDRAFGRRFADTWELGRTAWQAVTTSTPGPAVAGHAAAYDAAAGQVVLFGGTTTGDVAVDGTWTYEPTVHAGVRRVGTGCGGIDGLRFGSPPLLGEPALSILPEPIRVVPPWPSVVFLSPGLRAAPLPLGSCLLQLSDLSLTATGFNTLGEVVLPVPGDPALRGARLFVQLVTEARGGHAGFGLLGMSPAYELVIGD